jgi:hypothetical protein
VLADAYADPERVKLLFVPPSSDAITMRLELPPTTKFVASLGTPGPALRPGARVSLGTEDRDALEKLLKAMEADPHSKAYIVYTTPADGSESDASSRRSAAVDTLVLAGIDRRRIMDLSAQRAKSGVGSGSLYLLPGGARTASSGVLKFVNGMALVAGHPTAVPNTADPLAAAITFLRNKGFQDGDRIKVVGYTGVAPSPSGSQPVIFLTDANK